MNRRFFLKAMAAAPLVGVALTKVQNEAAPPVVANAHREIGHTNLNDIMAQQIEARAKEMQRDIDRQLFGLGGST